MQDNVVNPLAGGFYTVQEAARLVKAGGTRRIYGWLRGYPEREIGPLLSRDYNPLGETEEVSFLDLMEIRFVERFREHGVKTRTLRKAADTLRKELKTAHPFAYRHLYIVADKVDVLVKEIFLNEANRQKDVKLRSLLTKNFVMYEAIQQSLLPGVSFNPATEMAAIWTPLPDDFPGITVNPKVAYGHPALPNKVPTATLYNTYKAENKNLDAVAYWFQQSAEDVWLAVQFEQALDLADKRRAA